MARWVCIFDDAPEMLHIREMQRPRHLAFLRDNAKRIQRAGALCADEHPSGGLWVLDVADRGQAIALIETDPYFDPRYRKYRLFEWRWALNYPID